MDLSQHQRTRYLKGGERRQRNMKPTRIHFITRSLKYWLSPIGLHCELCLMLEVATSLHLHVKSAVTADCCNLTSTIALKAQWIGPCIVEEAVVTKGYWVRFPDGGRKCVHTSQLRHFVARVDQVGVVSDN